MTMSSYIPFPFHFTNWSALFNSVDLNRIEDEGATALADALRLNQSLETLG